MQLNLTNITQLTIILVVLLAIANIISTNVLATGGQELKTINEQTINYQKDNLYLKNKIAEVGALSYLETKAKNLGFISINQTIAIVTPAPVAYVAK